MNMKRLVDLAIWRSLSKPQKAALDAAADAPLFLKLRRGRWAHQSRGVGGHASNTVAALVKQGLLAHQSPQCVRITRKGADVFGSVGEPQ